jgi:hypothetical protein
VVQQVVAAGAANHLTSLVSGDSLGSFVPIRDHAIAIHEIDAVVKVVDDVLVEIAVFRHSASGKFGDGSVSPPGARAEMLMTRAKSFRAHNI